MIASSENSAPNSWEDFFTNGPDAEGLDKIHPDVSNLFHVSSNDDIETTKRDKMMASITDLRMNAIMFMSPLDDMIILHNNSKVGRDILNINIECFGTFGKGKSTIALKLLN